ncbi:MAG: hypothetical protein K0U76_14840 [Actinomycetia bacterium]|nr:hypothetical protein [Actinomycetes bacterium]MCH9702629.1 hypothetical protein [Actinomycetes bacterium]MCH9759284.1 hypothetical protein [Actinomycetes bacterium]
MSEFHTGPGADELRKLAESILDRLDPAMKLLVATVQAGGAGKCEQVWCPVCAVGALISGEQHPLLSVVSEHSVALLTLVKAMLDNNDSAGSTPQQPQGPVADAPVAPEPAVPPEPGHYQHIPVVVEDSAE